MSTSSAAVGVALARAGFRRYSTYRQATAAGLSTNIVFGMLRAYVLTATVAATAGTAAGYTLPQLSSYVWIGQGMIATVGLWGWNELADRVRTGDVIADLLRPINPLWTYLATDVGRAAFNALIRLLIPIAFGAVFFPFYWPEHLVSYPLFVLSVILALLVSFGCRYMVNLVSFWLLDTRGVAMLWMLASGVGSGLYFPLAFLPGWLSATLQYATPFPSILQFSCDIFVERGGIAGQLGRLGLQAFWAVVMIGAAMLMQRRAMRKLVIQGG